MQIFSKIIVASFVFLFTSLQTQTVSAQNNSVKMTNPLLQKSKLQYQAPVFDLIKDEHFKPAFEYGLKIHDQEIDKIANNPAKPTFENTVLALETREVDWGRARRIFNN